MGKQGAQMVVNTLASCQGFGQTHFVFLDWKGEQVLFSKLLLKKGGLIARQLVTQQLIEINGVEDGINFRG